MTDDDYLDEDFTGYSFSKLIAELERSGTILQQWESGEPDGIEPKQKPKKNYEKGETIQ